MSDQDVLQEGDCEHTEEHGVCMHLCIGVQEDSLYRVDRGFTSGVASSEASV